MSLSCKRPRLTGTRVGLPDLRIKKPTAGRPEIGAQFQLWIFSYTKLAARSKKQLSRLMIGFGAIAPDFAALHPGCETYSPAASFS
jgi:hypothetical protein